MADTLRMANALIPIIIGLELTSSIKKKRDVNIANALIPIIVALSILHAKGINPALTPESSLLLLSALPSMGPLIKAMGVQTRTSRFYGLLKTGASGLLNAFSNVGARIFGPPKPPQAPAITGKLLIENTTWDLGGSPISGQIAALPTPDMAHLGTLMLPGKKLVSLPNHIPPWVPKSVVAELNFNPDCDVGGGEGPTCLSTTMYKHIEALDEYNKKRSFSNGARWESARKAYNIAEAGTSDSEKRAFAADYPMKYNFYVKDASGGVVIKSVQSHYRTRKARAAGDIADTNLEALALIAPPEMIYNKTTNKSKDVLSVSIALLESLAACGTKLTLDDPDCEPLRVLGEIREFHAGQ